MPTKAARLTCATIADLANGMLGVMVDDEIRRIMNDLDERGKDGQDRTLTIKMKFSIDPTRSESGIAIDPTVESKYPAHRPMATNAKISAVAGGEMAILFQANNADDADQPSMLDDDATK